MASGAASPIPSGAAPTAVDRVDAEPAGGSRSAQPGAATEPILCGHCGRTASNGISCQGMCVADSGY